MMSYDGHMMSYDDQSTWNSIKAVETVSVISYDIMWHPENGIKRWKGGMDSHDFQAEMPEVDLQVKVLNSKGKSGSMDMQVLFFDGS